MVNNIFVPSKELRDAVAVAAQENASLDVLDAAGTDPNDRRQGTIHSLKEGFGFIAPASGGQNIFFHYSAVVNVDFSELKVGEQVGYEHGQNEKGVCAIKIQVVR